MVVNLDGEKVRKIRERNWMSGPELAKKAGVGATTIRNVEANKTPVRLSTARKIAKALGVEPKSLSGDGAEPVVEQQTSAA